MRADTRSIASFAWWHSAFAVATVIVLFGLGLENMLLRGHWHEVEDGVLWAPRAEGVTAVEVSSASPGDVAGVKRGDVLIGINGVPVRTPADVVTYYHRTTEGTRLSYQLLRAPETNDALEVRLASVPQASSMCFVLASVGLFALLVGVTVRVLRPRDPATLHFFWLCVAFFGAFTFSFNGPLDRLDWVFLLGGCSRSGSPTASSSALHARVSGTAQAAVIPFRRWRRSASLRAGCRTGSGSHRSDDQRIAGRFVVLVRDRAARSRAARLPGGVRDCCARRVGAGLSHDYRADGSPAASMDACGTVFGVAPFRIRLRSALGARAGPPFALQLTAIPLGLVPLTFASAIVRYRLLDVEIIVKRALGYAAFLMAGGLLYLAMRRLTGFLFTNDRDPGTGLWQLLATAVVILLSQPVKEAVQNALDRLFYRDRYDYRRALVGFARDLNADLDVMRLSHRLVTRIVETLLVERMALILTDERFNDFASIADFGFSRPVPRLSRNSSLWRGSMPVIPSPSTIRLRPLALPPRRSSSGGMPESTTWCPACSRAPRSRCSFSGGRRATSPSIAKISLF